MGEDLLLCVMCDEPTTDYRREDTCCNEDCAKSFCSHECSGIFEFKGKLMEDDCTFECIDGSPGSCYCLECFMDRLDCIDNIQKGKINKGINYVKDKISKHKELLDYYKWQLEKLKEWKIKKEDENKLDDNEDDDDEDEDDEDDEDDEEENT